MADCLYRSNWMRLPPRMQMYYVLMIGNVQQPQFYHGLGMIKLHLETYTRVRLICLSY